MMNFRGLMSPFLPAGRSAIIWGKARLKTQLRLQEIMKICPGGTAPGACWRCEHYAFLVSTEVTKKNIFFILVVIYRGQHVYRWTLLSKI